jgi:trehalose-phosphatase
VADRGLPGIPARLWHEARAASSRLLALDYDGTLAPLRAARAEAAPLPGVVETLGAIQAANGTQIAVVSGRSIDELAVLLGPLAVHLCGEHGWEDRAPGGGLVRLPLPDAGRAGLERAIAVAASFDWARRLERKRTAVVLHTRGIEPAAEALRIESECWSAWQFAATAGLRVQRVNGGLELRHGGQDKGTAIRRLIAASAVRPFCVYVGDDATDEDAFQAVQRDGYGIRVGAMPASTQALAHLPSCEAVREFLRTWLQVVEGGGRHKQ